jgi:hypothetical protein
MKPPFPADYRTLEAILAEVATAERTVSARLANVLAMESVGRQARNPIFQGPVAQAHLAGELDRLRGALTEPSPSLLVCGSYLVLPDPGLPAAEYLTAFHHELIKLHRTATSALAKIEEQAQKQGKPPKAPRNRGYGQAGLNTLKEEWSAGRRAPSYSELKRRHGWKSLSPAYAAYEQFYEWSEYKNHLLQCPNDHWGPDPKPPGKRRR